MNPCNNGIYSGWLANNPMYIKTGTGTVFQARFSLKVKREYKNKEGKYDYDYIPMRLYGENRIKVLEHLKKGDALSICGSVRTGTYEVNGKKVFEMYLNVDNITYTPSSSFLNSADKGEPEKAKAEENSSSTEQKIPDELVEKFDLPFR